MQFPLAGIQQFGISSQRFSGVNGRREGAAVNVVTKSGGREYHGSVFYQLRDRKLNANDFFSKKAGQPKPPFNRKIWGGSIGGPLHLPRFGEGGPAYYRTGRKTFFFFSIERQTEATSIPVASASLPALNLVQTIGAQPSSVIPPPYNDSRRDHAM